jgi:hypothetical protein
LKIRAKRTVTPGSGTTEILLDVWDGTAIPLQWYRLLTEWCPLDLPIDNDGFPIVGEEAIFSGPLLLQDFAYNRPSTLLAGSGDFQIRNLNLMPIREKPVPPVVERPEFTVEQLRAGPSSLQFGEQGVVFTHGDVQQDHFSGVLSASFGIWEQNLRDFDQARLDFVWVVHESGDVWQPDIVPQWDTYKLGDVVKDGPWWPVGTGVDIIVGFVDLKGEVWITRNSLTVGEVWIMRNSLTVGSVFLAPPNWRLLLTAL